MSLIDVKAVKEQAEKELREERVKDAVKRVKNVEKQILDAKAIVANLERERDDLLVAIGQGN